MRLMYLPATQEDIKTICSLSRQLIDTYEDVDSIPYEKVMQWVEKKIESSIGATVYIIAGVIIALLVFIFVRAAMKKSKNNMKN